MADQPVSVLEEKRASYLELFFDLVFVFAVTQVVTLLHSDTTFLGLARGAFLLLMLWWTWTIYTWTTNWSGTEAFGIRLAILGGMGASLLMALAVPEAFGDAGRWFAVFYFAVRIFAAAINWTGARNNPARKAALMTFLPLSLLAALLFLVGGFVDTPWRGAIWVIAMLVDFGSAASSGRGTFEIDAGHFAERNGLFVIIALGETIVAIGVGATHVERSAELVVSLSLTFVGAAVLWWSYFDRAQRAAEGYLSSVTGRERGRFARDAYSILHYPVVLGIILYAVAAEDVVQHPADALIPEFRFALAAGMSLVLLAVVAGTYRAVHRIPLERLVAALALMAVAAIARDLRADVFAAVCVAVVIVALAWERTHRWPQAEMETAEAES